MRVGLGGIIDDALALLSIFEAVSLAQLALNPYSLFAVGSLAWFQVQLFRWLALSSPLLLVLLLFSWAAIWALKIARKRLKALDSFLGSLMRIIRPRAKLSDGSLGILNHPRFLLVVALIVGGLLGSLPYWAGLNPSGSVVGVDTPLYIQWTRDMASRPFPEAMSYAFSQADKGLRPFPLIILYSISWLGLGPEHAVEFFPVILAPLLSLSSYLFIKTGSQDRRVAAGAALVACFSFNLTVGIWAGYLANWMAMIIAYFFLSCFFFFEKSSRKSFLVPLILLSVAMLLTHPWSWALVLATTLFYSLTRPGTQRRNQTIYAVMLILAGVIVDTARSQFASGTTLAADLGTKAPVFGVTQLLMFWPNVWNALTVLYDGIQGNALLLALSALAFVLVRFEGRLEGLLSCWAASASIPFVLLNSFHQSRLIYDLPIPPLAAIGLVFLTHRAKGGNLRATLIVLLTMLLVANFALEAIIQA